MGNWNALPPPGAPFLVYVIESNRPDEIAAGMSEAAALSHVLHFSGIPVKVAAGHDKGSLGTSLAALVQQALPYGIPVVHISSHGNEQGIFLTSGEFVSWGELFQMLEPLHQARSGQYFLSMSCCKGLNALALVMGNLQRPFLGIIGCADEVAWADNVIAFATFYHLSQKGRSASEAVEAMKTASGHHGYRFVAGDHQARVITWTFSPWR